MSGNGGPPEMDEALRQSISGALARIPSGLFIITAQHEERRLGMLCSWVQQVCFEPPMISVAIAKGRTIMPLISESRQFALCQLSEDDRLLLRKFSKPDDSGEDPFLGHELTTGRLSNLPVLANTQGYLECELACHMDFEGDHDLFVGAVKGGGFRDDVTPHVHVRNNGFNY